MARSIARRTPNGRTARLPKGEFTINQIRQNTDRLSVLNARAKDNAEETAKNRSAEITERQKAANLEKVQTAERIKEIEKLLLDKKPELKEQILASFKDGSIKETLTKFSSELNAYKLLSSEHLKLCAQTANVKQISLFNMFMLELAKAQPAFTIYLPEECFTFADTDNYVSLNDLTEAERAILQEKIEKAGLIDNPIFKKYFLRYFPKYINMLSEQRDIKTALLLSPESFKNLNGVRRSVLFENINLYNDLVKKVPQVLLYSTNEEIAALAKSNPSTIGMAISKCPEVLSKLSNEFFKTYHPKFVFNQPDAKHFAQKLINEDAALKEKFPTLVEYFKDKHIRVVGPRPKKPTYEFVPPTDPLDF